MKAFESLDVATIVSSDPTEVESRTIAENLLTCLQRDGIVAITNHGIDSQSEKDVYQEALNFFRLPTDVKQRMERFVKSGANGYTSLSGERSLYYGDLVDYKECYDLRNLDENSGEDVMPSFTFTMKEFAIQCKELATRILAALDLVMDTGESLITMHKDMLTEQGCTELRTLYYPPVPENVGSETVRCAAHTDYGTITLLFEDNAGGLQRKTKDGEYETIELEKGEALLMAGDMLEIFSAGRIRAVKHRVIIPPAANQRNTHRQSIAFFVQPDEKATITPLYSNSPYSAVIGGEVFKEKFDVIYPETHRRWYGLHKADAISIENQLEVSMTRKR